MGFEPSVTEFDEVSASLEAHSVDFIHGFSPENTMVCGRVAPRRRYLSSTVEVRDKTYAGADHSYSAVADIVAPDI